MNSLTQWESIKGNIKVNWEPHDTNCFQVICKKFNGSYYWWDYIVNFKDLERAISFAKKIPDEVRIENNEKSK